MDAPLGKIGKYTLLAKLAAGGMGEIFLAQLQGERGFEKLVVVKRLLPALVAEPEVAGGQDAGDGMQCGKLFVIVDAEFLPPGSSDP